MNLPQLRPNGSTLQLFVDGQPYLALGGELYNSASSDPAHLETILEQLAQSGIGTVIGTTSWEQVEP